MLSKLINFGISRSEVDPVVEFCNKHAGTRTLMVFVDGDDFFKYTPEFTNRVDLWKVVYLVSNKEKADMIEYSGHSIIYINHYCNMPLLINTIVCTLNNMNKPVREVFGLSRREYWKANFSYLDKQGTTRYNYFNDERSIGQWLNLARTGGTLNVSKVQLLLNEEVKEESAIYTGTISDIHFSYFDKKGRRTLLVKYGDKSSMVLGPTDSRGVLTLDTEKEASAVKVWNNYMWENQLEQHMFSFNVLEGRTEEEEEIDLKSKGLISYPYIWKQEITSSELNEEDRKLIAIIRELTKDKDNLKLVLHILTIANFNEYGVPLAIGDPQKIIPSDKWARWVSIKDGSCGHIFKTVADRIALTNGYTFLGKYRLTLDDEGMVKYIERKRDLY